MTPGDVPQGFQPAGNNREITDLQPRAAQVVSIGVGDGDERLDGVDVLQLHLGDGRGARQEGEAPQGLDVGVALQLHRQTMTAVIHRRINCRGANRLTALTAAFYIFDSSFSDLFRGSLELNSTQQKQ